MESFAHLSEFMQPKCNLRFYGHLISSDWRKLIDDDVYEYYREKSRKRMSNLFEGDIAGIDVEGMMMVS
jgi:hypothetical protein